MRHLHPFKSPTDLFQWHHNTSHHRYLTTCLYFKINTVRHSPFTFCTCFIKFPWQETLRHICRYFATDVHANIKRSVITHLSTKTFGIGRKSIDTFTPLSPTDPTDGLHYLDRSLLSGNRSLSLCRLSYCSSHWGSVLKFTSGDDLKVLRRCSEAMRRSTLSVLAPLLHVCAAFGVTAVKSNHTDTDSDATSAELYMMEGWRGGGERAGKKEAYYPKTR